MLTKFFPSQYNGADYTGRLVYNLDTGGGGGGAPANTTQVTIPEYAKPYMMRTLGKAEALTSAPYQTYGGERIASLDPLQEQAYGAISQLQTPGQFGAATGLAGAAGMAGLQQAGAYRPSEFSTTAVDPERAQYSEFGAQQAGQYMSPFMNYVIEAQKKSAIDDAQRSQLAQNLGAARQGTYGGSRQLMATLQREKALSGQLSDIQGKGLQAAFENAQQQFERDQARRMMAQGQNLQYGTQAQLANQQALLETQRMAEQSRQFGSDLGMRGISAALQGAQTLGGLGEAEQKSQMDIIAAQERAGAQQRANEQAYLDQQYQDFIAQQQHPYKQLGFMSDILRGSANLAGTGSKAVYEASPSMMSQLAGAGLSAAALYNLSNK